MSTEMRTLVTRFSSSDDVPCAVPRARAPWIPSHVEAVLDRVVPRGREERTGCARGVEAAQRLERHAHGVPVDDSAGPVEATRNEIEPRAVAQCDRGGVRARERLPGALLDDLE